ncbi:hypothetical protein L195_g033390 [Trifolium pratense]|uniref:Uncharacterized protein n=1 Tax=Trifolium pratense TaxID=57577 RepID=A0A2K3LFV4_TRIPR|nr:hypothetical protein L195_g033390 [Trifolium pratense]
MGSRFALLNTENMTETESTEIGGEAFNAIMGNSMQSISHNDTREKSGSKSTNEKNFSSKATNEKIKGATISNKSQKINATRANFKDKKGVMHGKKSDTLAEKLVPKEIESFISNHCNAMKQNDKVAGKITMDHKEAGPHQNATPIIMEHAQITEPVKIDPVHMNYHRDPGLKESKFFHGPMFKDRRPELDEPFLMQPKNNGGRSMEMEVFVDAKENGDSSSEEWDMDGMVEGANQYHEKMKGNGEVC